MAEEVILTKEGKEELEKRLELLKFIKRKEITERIKVAREFGDLSENAEYSAAKAEQEANEIEIVRLTSILHDAIIMDEKAINTKTVSIGNVVTVFDVDANEEVTYTLVSSLEANSRELKISDKSPIGKALVGHTKGETVYAQTPAGSLAFKIIDITK